jgi:hypothetical protein
MAHELRRSLLILSLFLMAADARAEFAESLLGDADVPLVRYRTENGVRLPEQKDGLASGHLFRFDDTTPLPGTADARNTTLPTLPQCAEGTVRRKHAGSMSANTFNLDYVFFDGNNEEDLARAKTLTTYLVPYFAGEKSSPETAVEQEWQRFALILGVNCLPTRFHFVEDGGKFFIEYREGTEAWVEPGKQ